MGESTNIRIAKENPGGGLGIFTDRNHRSTFLGYEFRKFVFFSTGHSCSIF